MPPDVVDKDRKTLTAAPAPAPGAPEIRNRTSPAESVSGAEKEPVEGDREMMVLRGESQCLSRRKPWPEARDTCQGTAKRTGCLGPRERAGEGHRIRSSPN